jgi:predicted dehydrogenase
MREIVEDSLYAGRHYYFNSEVHGMHYGEFANYAEYFADSILSGTPHSPDLREGLETFCIMEAARRSAHRRQPVDVAEIAAEVGL